MKRWGLAFVATVMACIPIILGHATSPYLLQDTDTRVLLAALRQRNQPLSWFVTDWPLKNHFYRPVSTLFFEFDQRVYGTNAAGFGMTNALLVVTGVLLLFWFLREFTDRPAVAGCGAVLFAAWNLNLSYQFSELFSWAIWITLIVGAVQHKKAIGMYVPAVLVLLTFRDQFFGVTSLNALMLHWLPSRTASVMTVFALGSMATYSRYLRHEPRKEADLRPSPLDPPATRSTRIRHLKPSSPRWLVASMVCAALALASYEQAVMVPAVILGLTILFHWKGHRVNWLWPAAFWGLLFGYLILRHAVVPSAPSAYQAQQFRTGPGLWLSLAEYYLPFAGSIPSFLSTLDQFPILLMTAGPYGFFLFAASNIATFVAVRRDWIYCTAGYLLSSIAYMPMAWLKQFDHYHYWPMSLRTLLVVSLGSIAGKMTLTAWSPPASSAPRRLSPAPGSLAHP